MQKVNDAIRSLNPHSFYAPTVSTSRKTATSPTMHARAKASSNPWNTTGASVFTDPTGNHDNRLGDYDFAELSKNPSAQDFSALGGLKNGQRIEARNPYTGKTVILTKGDVGAGGDKVRSKHGKEFVRGIDLRPGAAKDLGIDGLGIIQWRILGPGDKPSSPKKKALSSALADQSLSIAPPVDLSKPEMSFGAPTISPLVGTDPSNPQGAVNSAVLSTPPPPPVTENNALAALVTPAPTAATGGASAPLDPVKDSKTISAIDKYERRADTIDARKLPYLWGGGHSQGTAAQLRAYKGPLDCSGAVSKVLGIDPRVSGDFGSWGRRGRRTKGDGINVYYNDKHVWMEIVKNGKARAWGTSAQNDGGGAGWIENISPGYRSGFNVRHI